MILQLKDDKNTIIDLKYASLLQDPYPYEEIPVIYPLTISIGNNKYCLSYGANNIDDYNELILPEGRIKPITKGKETYDKYALDHYIIKNFLLNKLTLDS